MESELVFHAIHAYYISVVGGSVSLIAILFAWPFAAAFIAALVSIFFFAVGLSMTVLNAVDAVRNLKGGAR